ncbi:MAG: beta-galactosidase [Verrucomicrobiota bacterium]|nr:beta-galactosidase [Verrucomicrobiota bacterium]
MSRKMKIGASYYPELLDKSEWQKDLEVARKIGLSVLRCGEFAWSFFEKKEGNWTPEWALEFLDLALKYNFEIIWCTPSATPPPYLLKKWPDLYAVSSDAKKMPMGIRRHYCPSHNLYKKKCAKMTGKLYDSLGSHPAIIAWQIDNEMAGDGDTCWCEICRKEFHKWLKNKFETIDRFNKALQNGFWSQVYTHWDEIPLPLMLKVMHSPSLKLYYRRFRSDNWLDFYRNQYDVLKSKGAEKVTTNFFNPGWNMPFDQWQWRPYLDAISVSHYAKEENYYRFQLAFLKGLDKKPIWILEQKAGEHIAQNLFSDNLERIENNLKINREFGVEYSLYWQYRQHVSGVEMDHGCVVRHDGKATRIADSIKKAIPKTEAIPIAESANDKLLVFSFQQQWSLENRRDMGGNRDYREEIQENWYLPLRNEYGNISVGSYRDISKGTKIVFLPLMQMEEPGLTDKIDLCLNAGGSIVLTADFGQLDYHGKYKRIAPLQTLSRWIDVPEIEFISLAEKYNLSANIDQTPINGNLFLAIPLEEHSGSSVGVIKTKEFGETPYCLSFSVKKGKILLFLTAPDSAALSVLLKKINSKNLIKNG